VREWLLESTGRLATAVGEESTAYGLDEQEIELVLELARIAAHESNDRTNAPLAAYLVGLAHGRHPERTLRELADAASGGSAGG
jgi:hypothetical protein